MCLILLFGVACDLRAASPQPSWIEGIFQNLRAAFAKVHPSGANVASPAPSPAAMASNTPLAAQRRDVNPEGVFS
jgi:hypothetical protein